MVGHEYPFGKIGSCIEELGLVTICGQGWVSQRNRQMVQEHANTGQGAQDPRGINDEVGQAFLFFFF